MPRAVQKPVAAIDRFLLPQLNELKGMISAAQGTLRGKIDAIEGSLRGEIAALRSEIKRLDEKIDNLRNEVLSEIRHVTVPCMPGYRPFSGRSTISSTTSNNPCGPYGSGICIIYQPAWIAAASRRCQNRYGA